MFYAHGQPFYTFSEAAAHAARKGGDPRVKYHDQPSAKSRHCWKWHAARREWVQQW